MHRAAQSLTGMRPRIHLPMLDCGAPATCAMVFPPEKRALLEDA